MKPSPRRALIVIDVQNEYVDGGLRIEYPDVQRSLQHIGTAIDAARAAGLPVVVVRQSAPSGAPIFDPGSHGWQLHEVVAGRPHDHLVDKALPSAFAGTDLAAWLADAGVDTLSVVGFMTHNCVDATIRDAVHRGLAAEFLHDASGSVPYANRAGTASAEALHHAFTIVLQSRFAAVMGTGEWVAMIAEGRRAEPEGIVASHRQALQRVATE